MRLRPTLCAGLVGCALLSLDAQSAGLYGGLEYARERLRFNPHYYEPDGTPDGSFVNRARGHAGAVFIGTRHAYSPAFSIAAEARLAFSDTRWRLRIPDESASLRYDIRHSAALTLQPTFHVSEHVALFVEGGLAVGRIHEHKSGSTFSNYDKRSWRPGAVVGVGINMNLGEQWGLRLGYRETRYREVRYDARDNGGTVVERIRDKPRQAAWHLGVYRSF